tara:strand:+ start:314 stop:493 length:180 start_codon:yes stop_codon:yes gene_type:complete
LFLQACFVKTGAAAKEEVEEMEEETEEEVEEMEEETEEENMCRRSRDQNRSRHNSCLRS